MKSTKEQAQRFFESKGFNLFSIMSVEKLSLKLRKHLNLNQTSKLLSVGIIGSGGKFLWKKLPHPLVLETNPIDNYSINSLNEFNDKILLDDKFFQILFPDIKTILPLQHFSQELNLSSPSPNGLDINIDFGLWFSIRGLFICENPGWENIPIKIDSPCNQCTDKTCLEKNQPRNNCHYKWDQRYTEEQINYHAKASLKL